MQAAVASGGAALLLFVLGSAAAGAPGDVIALWALQQAIAVSAGLWKARGTTAASIPVAVAGLWSIGAVVRNAGGAAPEVYEPTLIAAAVSVGWAGRGLVIDAAERFRRWLLPLGLALLSAPLLPVIGVSIRGSARWVDLPGLPQMQPGQLGLVVLLVAFAGWVAASERHLERVDTTREAVRVLVPASSVIVMAAGILIVARDLGTLLLMSVTVSLLVCSVATRRAIVVTVVGAAVGGLVLGGAVSSVARERLLSWLMRDFHPHVQASVARVHAGGLTGRGVDSPAIGSLPEWNTDLMATSVSSVYGLLGTTVVVALTLVIATIGWRAADADVGASARLTQTAVLAIGVQMLWTIAMAVAALPVTGIPSPLLSAGMSSQVAVGLWTGLIAAGASPIARHGRRGSPLSSAAPGVVVVSLILVMRVAATALSGFAAEPGVAARDLAHGSYVKAGPIISADDQVLHGPHERRAGSWTIIGLAGGLSPDGRGIYRVADIPTCPVRPLERIACRTQPTRTTVHASAQTSIEALALQGQADIVVLAADGRLLAAADADGAHEHDGTSTDGRQGAVGEVVPPAAITRLSSPGSTFKIVTLWAALNDADLADRLWSTEGDWVSDAGTPIRDHGPCDPRLEVALPPSCNTVFAQAGQSLGSEALTSAASDLGMDFDSDSAVGWPAEPARLPSSPAVGDPAGAAIGGAGVALAPLHVATAAASIMSGATVHPRLTEEPSENHPVPTDFAPQVVEQLRAAMTSCVNRGTCHGARHLGDRPGVRLGAKTGTAPTLDGGSDAWAMLWVDAGEAEGLAIGVRAPARTVDGQIRSRSGASDAIPVAVQAAEVLLDGQ